MKAANVTFRDKSRRPFSETGDLPSDCIRPRDKADTGEQRYSGTGEVPRSNLPCLAEGVHFDDLGDRI